MIREQNVMAANEIIELFCELIVVRLQIIAKQRLVYFLLIAFQILYKSMLIMAFGLSGIVLQI